MISGLLLLDVWVLLLSFLLKAPLGLPGRLMPPIAFALSKSCLFFVYLFLIRFADSATSRISLTFFGLSSLVLFILRPRHLKDGVDSIRGFVFPVEQAYPFDPAKKQKLLTNIRLFLTLLGLGLLCGSSFLIASPQSWDSYTYNLSRILLMIFKGTPFLFDVPSIPQATFPLGHDLLFYPDLLLGNLRGLGLVNTLEFIVILGCLLSLTDLILKNKAHVESARFLSVCLLFSSDQQVLQAISTKNDIPITALFLSSLLVSGAWIRERHRFSFGLLALITIFLGTNAYASKSYGVIVFFPILFVCLGFLLLSSKDVHKQINSGSVRQVFLSKLGLLCSLLIAAYAFFLLRFSAFINSHYANLPQYHSSVGRFVSSFPSPLEYLEVAFFNLSRVFVRFMLYPYSLFLKHNAQSPDDYLIGLSPIVNALNNARGIVKGYSFGLVRFRSEDHSLAGPLFHLSLVLLMCLLILALIKGRKNFMLFLQDKMDCNIAALIIMSSFSSSLLISAILSYHNWLAKYFGFAYVPVIAIIACSMPVALLFVRHELSLEINQLFVLLVPVLVALSLSSILFSVGLSSRFFSFNFFPSQADLPLLYREYLGKRRLEENRFFSPSYVSQGYSFTVCYGEETLSLPMLLELTRLEVSRSAVSFKSLNSSQCLPNQGNDQKVNTVVLP